MARVCMFSLILRMRHVSLWRTRVWLY